MAPRTKTITNGQQRRWPAERIIKLEPLDIPAEEVYMPPEEDLPEVPLGEGELIDRQPKVEIIEEQVVEENAMVVYQRQDPVKVEFPEEPSRGQRDQGQDQVKVELPEEPSRGQRGQGQDQVQLELPEEPSRGQRGQGQDQVQLELPEEPPRQQRRRNGVDLKTIVKRRFGRFSDEFLNAVREELGLLRGTSHWDRNVNHAPLASYFVMELFPNENRVE